MPIVANIKNWMDRASACTVTLNYSIGWLTSSNSTMSKRKAARCALPKSESRLSSAIWLGWICTRQWRRRFESSRRKFDSYFKFIIFIITMRGLECTWPIQALWSSLLIWRSHRTNNPSQQTLERIVPWTAYPRSSRLMWRNIKRLWYSVRMMSLSSSWLGEWSAFSVCQVESGRTKLPNTPKERKVELNFLPMGSFQRKDSCFDPKQVSCCNQKNEASCCDPCCHQKR